MGVFLLFYILIRFNVLKIGQYILLSWISSLCPLSPSSTILSNSKFIYVEHKYSRFYIFMLFFLTYILYFDGRTIFSTSQA